MGFSVLALAVSKSARAAHGCSALRAKFVWHQLGHLRADLSCMWGKTRARKRDGSPSDTHTHTHTHTERERERERGRERSALRSAPNCAAPDSPVPLGAAPFRSGVSVLTGPAAVVRLCPPPVCNWLLCLLGGRPFSQLALLLAAVPVRPHDSTRRTRDPCPRPTSASPPTQRLSCLLCCYPSDFPARFAPWLPSLLFLAFSPSLSFPNPETTRREPALPDHDP